MIVFTGRVCYTVGTPVNIFVYRRFMPMKMGEMIRTLRRKAGKTQEALAEALGMSTQAVSRWESGGGYPDVELIPRIANYFHVSIDELFGYDGDRQDKIRAVLKRADGLITGDAVTEECITELREALLEFPDDLALLLRLGYALSLYGVRNHGARRTMGEDGYPVNDTAYNRKNPCFREAVMVLEKVLTLDPEPEDRDSVLARLVLLYGWMGEWERAETLAHSCTPVHFSRETMLAMAADGEARGEYIGNEILSLADALAGALQRAVQTLGTVEDSYAAEILEKFAGLFESLFANGRCGEYHLTLCRLYLLCTADPDEALVLFDRAFDHGTAYNAVRKETVFTYEGPLVNGARKNVYTRWPRWHMDVFKGYRRGLSAELLVKIDAEGKYVSLRQADKIE